MGRWGEEKTPKASIFNETICPERGNVNGERRGVHFLSGNKQEGIVDKQEVDLGGGACSSGGKNKRQTPFKGNMASSPTNKDAN